LYLEGSWNLLRETKDIGSLLGAIQPPYYEVDYTGLSYTIYDIINQVLIAAGTGLYALGGEDDSIVDTLQPDFVINSVPFEDAATVIYRLLNMTKVFCRAETEATETTTGPNTVDDNITEVSAVFPLYTRKTFWAVGRYWVFWSDGTNLVYSTSADGSTFSSPTTVAAAIAEEWAITFDYANNKVAYVRAVQGATDYVYWRQGEPQTNGTITYDAVEQEVRSLVGLLNRPNCCFDSTGHAWVTWAETGLKPYASKNDNTDGTWSDATNFPHEISSSTRQYTAPIPLLDGKVYVVTIYHSAPNKGLYGYLYDASWGSEETIDTGEPGTGKTWSAVAIGDVVHFAYRDTDGSPDDVIHCIRSTAGAWSQATVFSADDDIYPQLTNVGGVLYMFWDSYPATNHVYFRKYDGTWDSTDTDQWTEDDAGGLKVQRVTAPYEIHNDTLILVWMSNTASPYKIRAGIMEVHNASFRIKYPAGYSSYDYTYTSDQTNGDHQFREFEWRDQIRIPNIVYVIANQAADGNWDSVIVGKSEIAVTTNNQYPSIVEYYVASTLTGQTDADNRAAAIALRRRLEQQLGRVVVPHNCGQELYDWIKIRDKRPTGSYVDYPPTRWGNEAIVGSLIHVYDPANGVYNLEMTINGIDSSAPVDATIPIIPVEEELTELEEASKKTKEIVRKLETGEERIYFPTEIPLTEYGQQRLSEQMAAMIEEYGMEGLKERFLKASEEFRKTPRWQEEERRWAAGETWTQKQTDTSPLGGGGYLEMLKRLRETDISEWGK